MLNTVAAHLAAQIAAGRLDDDPAQHAAALRLDALREILLSGSPKIFQRLRSWWPADKPMARRAGARGIYLWGGVGRGKTLLMDWFFESLENSRATPPAARAHFYHFMRDVHAELAAIKGNARPLELVAQRIAARSRLICLDEFFVSDIADAMILAGLFAALFRRGVTLVTTSNLAPHALYKDGLQRQRFLPAIDLILDHVEVIHLDGGIDYRLRRLEQAPTYLDSLAAESAAALGTRFAALTGGSSAGPATLVIEGRNLHAVDLANGTAWFEFRELCVGPRSQHDYIELARLYHTIFIANIPVFEHADDNAARRFIMLIDELYDRGVKIVVSAAAAPAALYRGERLRFEFERAASRLIEMQTLAYLARQHRP